MEELVTRLGWNLVLCIPFGILVWCLTRTPKICTRPAICHGLWLLVLLKMVTPPFIPMTLVPDVLNISADRFSKSAAQPPATIEPEQHPIVADSTTQTALSPQRSPSPAPRVPVILAADRSNMHLGRVATIATVLASLAVTMGIWLVAFRQLQRLQRLLTGHQPQSDRANQLLGKLAPEFRLRTIPDLINVDSPIAPFVWAGPRQPVVVLSQQLIQSLDDGQLEFVLAHELAHLKRCDHWSNLFGFFVTTLFWWHPVAWLAKRELGLAAEACCDAMALERCSGSRKSCAQTLLSVTDLMNCRELPGPVLNADGLRCSDKGFLPMSLDHYFDLLDWTGRQLVRGKKGRIPKSIAPILQRLKLDRHGWCELVGNFGKRFFHVAGDPTTIDTTQSRVNQHRYYMPRETRKVFREIKLTATL